MNERYCNEQCKCPHCSLETARRERDEAREVARRLMEAVDYAQYNREFGELPSVLWERFPWLKEAQGGR